MAVTLGPGFPLGAEGQAHYLDGTSIKIKEHLLIILFHTAPIFLHTSNNLGIETGTQRLTQHGSPRKQVR